MSDRALDAGGQELDVGHVVRVIRFYKRPDYKILYATNRMREAIGSQCRVHKIERHWNKAHVWLIELDLPEFQGYSWLSTWVSRVGGLRGLVQRYQEAYGPG